jgi:hypothetical protein
MNAAEVAQRCSEKNIRQEGLRANQYGASVREFKKLAKRMIKKEKTRKWP